MAERKISTRIELSGEKELKQALANINSELRLAQSELKLVSKEYANNANSTEALTKKGDALRKVQEAQAKKTEELKKALADIQKAQESYTDRVRQAEEQTKKAEENLDRLAQAVGESSEEYKQAQEELEGYRKNLEQAKKEEQECTRTVNDWQVKVNDAQGALASTNKALEENEKYLKEAKESTDGCAVSIDQYGKKTKEAAQNTKESGEALRETAQAAEENREATKKNREAVEALAAAIVASGLKAGLKELISLMQECTGESAAFETAMKKVSTVAGAGADMSAMSDDVIALSGEMAIAAGDISEAVYNAISASVDAENAVAFVKQANKLAVAGFTESATAVDVLTTAINAYNLETSEAGQLADYLITTQNLGKTTVNELAASMGRVIPVASANNVEMDNLSSAMAVLTRNGIQTQMATTYLAVMLQELGKNGTKVADALEANTGKSFAALSAEGKNLGEILDILYQECGENTTEFNNMWQSATAGTAALSIVGSGVEDYNNVMKKMNDSVGATESAYEKMTDTAEYAGKRLQNSVENLKIAVGDQLSPVLVQVEDGITGMTQAAEEYVKEHPETVAAIGATMAAVGTLTAVVGGYTVVTKIAIPLILEFNTAMAANPAAIWVVAISAVIAAITAYNALVKDATAESKELADAARELRDEVTQTKEAYEEASDGYHKHAQSIADLWKEIKELSAAERKTEEDKKELSRLVDELNAKVPGLELSYNGLTDSLNMTAEAAEALIRTQQGQEAYTKAIEARTDAYAKQEKAEEELKKAQENLAGAQEELTKAQEAYDGAVLSGVENLIPYDNAVSTAKVNLANYQSAVEDAQEALEACDETISTAGEDVEYYGLMIAQLGESEREVVNAALEAADALGRENEVWGQSIEGLSGLVEQHQQNCASIQADIEAVKGEMDELQMLYNKTFSAAYDSIDGQMGLFNEMKVESKQSVDDMIAGLDSQIEYMETYSENMKKATDMGLDSLLRAQLTDGSAESAAILQEIVDNGEGKIKELNEKFAKVEEGKMAFADSMADMETNFSASMDNLEARLAEAEKKMDMEEEAFADGVNTIQGYIKGSESERKAIITTYGSLADAANKAYRDKLQIKSPSRVFKKDGEETIEGAILGAKGKEEELKETYRELASSATGAFKEDLQKLKEEYDESIESISKSLDGQFGLFKKISVESKQSVDDMIAGLDSQMNYMASFSANMQQAMAMGVNEGILAQLADGSAESAEILQGLVNGGADKIAELNAKFEAVKEGKQAFAGQMAELEVQFGASMDNLEARLAEATAEMNQENEAYANGVFTIQGFLDGSESMREQIVKKYNSLAEAANKAWKEKQEINSPSKVFERYGSNDMDGVIVGAKKKERELREQHTRLAAAAGEAYKTQAEKETRLRDIDQTPPQGWMEITLPAGRRIGKEKQKPQVIVNQTIYAENTSYKGQQREAEKRMREVARMVAK